MSRLDAFIRRMQAQRACIELAADLVSGLEGFILELGLGQGRTFDHIRETFPDRKIYLVDDCMNPADGIEIEHSFAFKGDVVDVLPKLFDQLGAAFSVIHSDIGGSLWNNYTVDSPLISCLESWIPRLTIPNGVVVSNLPVSSVALVDLDLPSGIKKDKIYLYQRR